MQPLLSEERDIIKNACSTSGGSSGTITFTLRGILCFVKYGISKALINRIKTQLFLLNDTPQSDHKPRIPLLFDFFEEEGKTYAVMEYIHVTIPPSSHDFKASVKNTLRWLSEVEAPPDHKFGPLGGGYIMHEFFNFNEGEAPLAFSSVEALERYMGKAHQYLGPTKTQLKQVTFKDENLMFVQGAMGGGHIGLDDQGRTVLMGFGSISFLPKSFGTYALQCTQDFARLPDALGWGASNMDTMMKIASVLVMVRDPTLGLDENGKRVTRR